MGIADALKNWKLAPSADNDRDLVDEVNATELDTSLLSAKLRGYQLFGARYILKQKHVLLGDEMGLGKTIQAIAVIAHLSAKGAGRFLVVCPLSVMVNWAREIEKHSLLKAVAIHGNDRGEEYERWRTEGCVGVTSYETLERLPMKEIKALDMLVVDEAHNVKNSKARRTQNVLLLVQKAERVLYMTGTPLENRLEEMRYLIESIDHATGVKLKMLPSVMNKQFADMISHVYLRRNREDVLTELPELIETEEWIEMNETEKKAYKESLKSKNFMAVRRISWNAGEASGKLTRLKELCEEAKEDGRRVLVFSYFLDTLEICESALGADCVGRIDGGLSPLKRQELVDRFREASDGAVLLGQVTAAGVGLNIQAASVVIFCEPQLKPSMEEQAIARAYRMGQERGVTVYRLLIKDGIDERILEILKEKQKLFENYADRSVVGDEDMKKNREAYIQEVMEDELKRLEGKDTEGVPGVEAHTAAEEAPAVEEHAAVKGMPAAEESPRGEASNSETLPSEIEPAYSSTEQEKDQGAAPPPDNNP